jgi:serine/threonine protein kinase
LQGFHDEAELGGKGKTYGLLTPKLVYWDQRNKKLLLHAVGVSNFLWHTMGWERLAAWGDEDRNAAAYVAPEQIRDEQITHKTDQYMLGQLAFEMLEGRLPFDIRRPSEVQKKKEKFWANPETTARRKWPVAHQAFASIIFKMLRRNPSERWENFDQLIKRLRTMEDENRALAKRTYEGLSEYSFRLKNNGRFFRDFYAAFFRKAEHAEKKFDSKVDQPKKLMDAMEAVLNFRSSNEPTSLSRYMQTHRDRKVTTTEVEVFRDVFLDTLKRKLPRRIPKKQRKQIDTAWKDLFSPIVEYFREELQKPPIA